MRALCLTLLIGCGTCASQGAETATMLDGKRAAITIAAINNHTISTSDGNSIPLDQLRSIVCDVSDTASKEAKQVHLQSGTVLPVDTVSLKNNHVAVSWNGKRSIPTSAMRAIRLSRGNAGGPVFTKAMGAKVTDDQIVVATKSGYRILKGVILSLDAKFLNIQYKGKPRDVAVEKIYGIVFASTPNKNAYKYKVHVADGSLIHGNDLVYEKGSLTVDLIKETAVKLPWKTVRAITVFSDKLVFLSDLTPVSTYQRPIVTFSSTWKKDRNLFGTKLTIGSSTFDKGIGVHSHSRLVFDSKGFATFAAVIGIDSGAKGKGDCIFRVLGDGKKLFERRIKGSDKPFPINVQLNGVAQLTLEVLPGDNLDVGDHGNWADARLLK